MKIKKGYTLSQFVDLKNQSINLDDEPWENWPEAYQIILYNDLLKQPLKKEMFVNEFGKSKGEPPFETGIGHHDYIKWKEAEKKVIFKRAFLKNVGFGSVEVRISRKLRVGMITSEGEELYNYKTIGELFQATSGELDLQNVDL